MPSRRVGCARAVSVLDAFVCGVGAHRCWLRRARARACGLRGGGVVPQISDALAKNMVRVIDLFRRAYVVGLRL